MLERRTLAQEGQKAALEDIANALDRLVDSKGTLSVDVVSY